MDAAPLLFRRRYASQGIKDELRRDAGEWRRVALE